MRIKVTDLRAVSDLLLRHLEKQGLESVELTKDYYWDLPKEYLYDPLRDPVDFDLGQLSDDWSDLLRIREDEGELLGSGFIWLSSILRAVGEEIIEQKL